MRYSNRFRYLLLLAVFSLVVSVSCKSKRLQINPGAYVTMDGTDDGLRNIQRDFGDASRTEEGILVTLESDVSFAINSSFLNDAAKRELDKLARALEAYPNVTLLIEGHTDATGTPEYNLQLSEKRARSVRDYLISKGIAKSRFTVEGHGQSQPVAPNNTAEGRKKNRRVEITIVD